MQEEISSLQLKSAAKVAALKKDVDLKDSQISDLMAKFGANE